MSANKRDSSEKVVAVLEAHGIPFSMCSSIAQKLRGALSDDDDEYGPYENFISVADPFSEVTSDGDYHDAAGPSGGTN